MVTLGHKDVDLVLALLGEAAAEDGEQPFELPVIQRLHELIPGERAGYFEYRWHSTSARLRKKYKYPRLTWKHEFVRDLYKVEEPFFELGWGTEEVNAAVASWPLRDPACRGSATALKLGDFLTRRQCLRNRWYVDVMRPRSVEFQLKLLLPSPDDVVRGFWVERGPGRADFDERDREVLTLLRPHLAVIRERWERRRRPPGLTEREAEVLRLVRDGLTNAEIADSLVISTTTVRAHLENVFEKFAVHTRTAAVARAFGAR